MNDKVFLDTNMLVYAYSSNDPGKRASVTALIERTPEIVISTQVVNELINVFRKKMKLEHEAVGLVIQELSERFEIVTISLDTIMHALHISRKYGYTYFDSLMLASALEHGCHIIYSEDMSHEQVIERELTIRNIYKIS